METARAAPAPSPERAAAGPPLPAGALSGAAPRRGAAAQGAARLPWPEREGAGGRPAAAVWADPPAPAGARSLPCPGPSSRGGQGRRGRAAAPCPVLPCLAFPSPAGFSRPPSCAG